MSAQEDSPPPKSRTRRRWKRWVFPPLILFTALLIWFNGPGIRWTLQKIILKQLENHKLKGSFEITGTALNGLALHKLSLHGETRIKSIHADLLKLTWTPSSLFHKRIDTISLEKLHLSIDPSYTPPPAPEEPPPSPHDTSPAPKLSETLQLIRQLLRPTELSLHDLRLDIITADTLSLGSLTHLPDSDHYTFTHLRGKDHLGRNIHNPSTTLTWTELGLHLDQITLLPKLSLQNITFHPEKKTSGEILIDGKKISLSSDLQSSHLVTLNSPPLHIPTILEIIQPDLLEKKQINGLITALEIDTSTGHVDIRASDLRWDKHHIPHATVQASSPHLLSPFGQDIKIEAELEDRLTLAGTITPSPKFLDSSAQLTFTLNDPAIPSINGELHYHSRQAQLSATALDTLLLDATYFLDSSTYQLQLHSTLPDAHQLHPKLSGPLTFILQGNGSLKDQQHHGSLDLKALQLQHPTFPETTTAGIIHYHWPEKITVENLTTTSPQGQLQAQLDWQDDTLNISQLSLIESGQALLHATAQLPAPFPIPSLQELSNSTKPISLNLKSEPLSLKKLATYLPLPPHLSGILLADLKLSGTIAQPTLNGFANLDRFHTTTQPQLPPLDLQLQLKTKEQKLLFTSTSSQASGPLLHLDGTLPFLPRLWIETKTKPDQNTPIQLHLHTPKIQLQTLQQNHNTPQTLRGTLETDLTLTGTLAQPTLNGFLTLDRLLFPNQPHLPPLDLNLKLKTQQQRLLLSAQANEPTDPLLQLDADLPFLPQLWTTATPIHFDAPISLNLTTPTLNLKKLKKLLGLPEQTQGQLESVLSLSGTISKPKLQGSINLSSFRLQNQPDLSPVDLDLNIDTLDQKLFLSATTSDRNGPLFNVKANLPLLTEAWIEKQASPLHTPIQLHATSPKLNLRRILPFVPIITHIDGSAQLDLLLDGSFSAPSLNGSANARIKNMRLAKSPISTFRDSQLNATFRDQTITIQPSTINASGGKATLSGTVALISAQPSFDLTLTGKHILLQRTPDYTFRGHPQLKLTGPYSNAKISGTLQVTESLFYKDLEILPFGIPRTTEIPQPNLPNFSQKITKTKNSTPPSGPLTWGLDIDVTTADPILIRGNLARGEITGNVKVTGTIDQPKTSGTLTSKELVADLPFSDLEVRSSLVTLRPESLTNPLIDLRGSSSIGQYTVEVFLTGPVQDPTLILTSDPPLPESEIMLLLATGSASEELENQQVASQKALQYLLEGLRRRNRGKDKSVAQRLLKNSDQIQLSLGDTNQFSGRRFSSATLEISDQWDFTTQIDEFGQTRALVVFSVRLK